MARREVVQHRGQQGIAEVAAHRAPRAPTGCVKRGRASFSVAKQPNRGSEPQRPSSDERPCPASASCGQSARYSRKQLAHRAGLPLAFAAPIRARPIFAPPTVQSSPDLTIPTANHVRFAALRISSIGLVQGVGGTGESMPWISKSPLGGSRTPGRDVRLGVKGAVG